MKEGGEEELRRRKERTLRFVFPEYMMMPFSFGFEQVKYIKATWFILYIAFARSLWLMYSMMEIPAVVESCRSAVGVCAAGANRSFFETSSLQLLVGVGCSFDGSGTSKAPRSLRNDRLYPILYT